MEVKELIKKLETFEQNAKILVSSDKELNCLFNDFEVSELDNGEGKKNDVVIFGLSGSEEEY